jgi:hypothetical protein
MTRAYATFLCLLGLGATVGEKGIVVASGFNALTSFSGVLFRVYTEVEEERGLCAGNHLSLLHFRVLIYSDLGIAY